MKALLDKNTNLWKWGVDGEPKYKTKRECELAGIDIVAERLNAIKLTLDAKNRIQEYQ